MNIESFNKKDIKNITNLYTIKNKSATHIAKIYKCWYPLIIKLLKKYGIKTRKRGERINKFQYNEKLFNKINSQDISQIFGFICADGNIHSKNTRVSIEISAIDVQYLKQIHKKLDSPCKIKHFTRITMNNKISKMINLSLCF